MKKSYLILIVAALISFAACVNNNSQKGESADKSEEVNVATEETYQGMQKVDLTEYAIAGSLYIPDEKKGVAKITETAYGSVQIEVGKRFGLEIVPFGQSLKEKKLT